jgi:hypothetical protein
VKGRRSKADKAAAAAAVPRITPERLVRRTYDVHLTVEVLVPSTRDREDDCLLIEECVTELVDDELSQHEHEGKRWRTRHDVGSIKLDNATGFDVRFVEEGAAS